MISLAVISKQINVFGSQSISILDHISELIHSTKMRFLKHCFSNLCFVFRRSLKIIKPHLKQSSSNRIDFESCFSLVKRKYFQTKKISRPFCYQYPPKHLHNNSESVFRYFWNKQWNGIAMELIGKLIQIAVINLFIIKFTLFMCLGNRPGIILRY